MENKCEASKLEVGEKLSRISYMTVKGKQGGYITVENEGGTQWDISQDIVSKECYSAKQASEEVEVNLTKLIQIFNEVGDTVFTVNFDKLPTHEDFIKLTRDEDSKIRSYADMKKDFKAFRGTNRTLVGYLVRSENGFGRSLVVDLEAEKGEKKSNLRQVDHRTLNWLIVKNIKYIVK